jgi:hypothetical protein
MQPDWGLVLKGTTFVFQFDRCILMSLRGLKQSSITGINLERLATSSETVLQGMGMCPFSGLEAG